MPVLSFVAETNIYNNTMTFICAACALILLISASRAAPGCSNFDSQPTDTCLRLFKSFQAALVERELNLFNLRKTFLPTNNTVPSMMNVTYLVYVTPTSQTNCPGEGGKERLPGNTSFYEFNFAWTNNAFYTIFHPAVVNRLQPQYIYSWFIDHAQLDRSGQTLTWSGVGQFLGVLLILRSAVPCIPTYTEVEDTLVDITAMVSVFDVFVSMGCLCVRRVMDFSVHAHAGRELR